MDRAWVIPAGRVGLHPAIRCSQEGTLRVRRSHYQQSNGVDGGDPGAPRVQGAVRSRNHDRRRVRSARNHAVGDPMETPPLVEEEPLRFTTRTFGWNWTSWSGSTKRTGSGPRDTPLTRITTVAIGLPKMPPGRRPVRGPTARRTGASG